MTQDILRRQKEMKMSDQSQSPADADAATVDLPLSGIRVLEFCHTIMGPSCGLVLADLGAEVIKVEPAPLGDRTRNLKGFVAGTFAYFNRNKKSIGIDLKSEEGRAFAHAMIRDADVLVENYAPGTAERIGLGYEEVSKLNPRLIYCTLKGFLPGPYETRPALDEVVQYMAGLAYMTGEPGKPMRAGASIVDILGGVFGAMAILTALRQRDRTGLGAKVGSALFETAAFLVGQHMAGEAATGIPAKPMPVRGRSWAIYETFRTGDDEIVFVGITSDRHWAAFCKAFGQEALLTDPRYTTNEKRLTEHGALQAIIAGIAAGYSRQAFMDILVANAIPAAPVATPGDLFEDPHLNANNWLVETSLVRGGTAKLPRLPMFVDELALGIRMQPPTLGEHTHELATRHGLSDEDVKRLLRAQILA
ncbi:CoA transferase [Shinella yambaruensis]|uniref:CaiB/BaiF CoA transferase family protein n=1 Tax=Shinella yambaruensis TaxID=415996 RepID=UPI003D794599